MELLVIVFILMCFGFLFALGLLGLAALLNLLCRLVICRPITFPKPADSIRIRVDNEEDTMIDTLTVGVAVNLLAFPEANGGPGAISDVPTWENDIAADLVPAADGLSCGLTPRAAGTLVMTCRATNSVGVAISGSRTFAVVLPPADSIRIAVEGE